MQGASDQFLTRSAFADHQYRRFDSCGLRNLFIYVDHLRRSADDLAFGERLGQLGADGFRLRQLEFLFDAVQDPQHLIDDKRFADVVECPVVHRMDGGFHRAVSRHDDDLRVRVDAFHAFQQMKTGIVPQVDIAHQNVKAFFLHGAACLFAGQCHTKWIRLHLEDGSHQFTNRSIVVHDQDLGFCSHTVTEASLVRYRQGEHRTFAYLAFYSYVATVP